jgi:hypothetical protein
MYVKFSYLFKSYGFMGSKSGGEGVSAPFNESARHVHGNMSGIFSLSSLFEPELDFDLTDNSSLVLDDLNSDFNKVNDGKKKSNFERREDDLRSILNENEMNEQIVERLSHYCYYLHYSINFVLYTFNSKKFRQKCSKLFTKFANFMSCKQ